VVNIIKEIMDLLNTRLNNDLTQAVYIAEYADYADTEEEVVCSISIVLDEWKDKGLGTTDKDVYGFIYFTFKTRAQKPIQKIVEAQDELLEWVKDNYGNYTDGVTSLRTIELLNYREQPYDEGDYIKNKLVFKFWYEYS